MGMLKITDCTGHHYTSIDNAFIDSYMAEANGEYVKVYLLLLRRMGETSPFSVSEFAEILENTEGDIIRALKYWAKRGLLTIEYGPDGEMTGLQIDSLSRKEERLSPAIPSVPTDKSVAYSSAEAATENTALPRSRLRMTYLRHPALPSLLSVISANTRAVGNLSNSYLLPNNISDAPCPLPMWRHLHISTIAYSSRWI